MNKKNIYILASSLLLTGMNCTSVQAMSSQPAQSREEKLFNSQTRAYTAKALDYIYIYINNPASDVSNVFKVLKGIDNPQMARSVLLSFINAIFTHHLEYPELTFEKRLSFYDIFINKFKEKQPHQASTIRDDIQAIRDQAIRQNRSATQIQCTSPISAQSSIYEAEQRFIDEANRIIETTPNAENYRLISQDIKNLLSERNIPNAETRKKVYKDILVKLIRLCLTEQPDVKHNYYPLIFIELSAGLFFRDLHTNGLNIWEEISSESHLEMQWSSRDDGHRHSSLYDGIYYGGAREYIKTILEDLSTNPRSTLDTNFTVRKKEAFETRINAAISIQRTLADYYSTR